ncbi:MAG: hypothetical protein K0M45_11940 [Candidatus Paracaedibacteraceae bacterium]|nr:hypothetical protein [Candidatus Paracaedibacteraceae bacterium]
MKNFVYIIAYLIASIFSVEAGQAASYGVEVAQDKQDGLILNLSSILADHSHIVSKIASIFSADAGHVAPCYVEVKQDNQNGLILDLSSIPADHSHIVFTAQGSEIGSCVFGSTKIGQVAAITISTNKSVKFVNSLNRGQLASSSQDDGRLGILLVESAGSIIFRDLIKLKGVMVLDVKGDCVLESGITFSNPSNGVILTRGRFVFGGDSTIHELLAVGCSKLETILGANLSIGLGSMQCTNTIINRGTMTVDQKTEIETPHLNNIGAIRSNSLILRVKKTSNSGKFEAHNLYFTESNCNLFHKKNAQSIFKVTGECQGNNFNEFRLHGKSEWLGITQINAQQTTLENEIKVFAFVLSCRSDISLQPTTKFSVQHHLSLYSQGNQVLKNGEVYVGFDQTPSKRGATLSRKQASLLSKLTPGAYFSAKGSIFQAAKIKSANTPLSFHAGQTFTDASGFTESGIFPNNVIVINATKAKISGNMKLHQAAVIKAVTCMLDGFQEGQGTCRFDISDEFKQLEQNMIALREISVRAKNATLAGHTRLSQGGKIEATEKLSYDPTARISSQTLESSAKDIINKPGAEFHITDTHLQKASDTLAAETGVHFKGGVIALVSSGDLYNSAEYRTKTTSINAKKRLMEGEALDIEGEQLFREADSIDSKPGGRVKLEKTNFLKTRTDQVVGGCDAQNNYCESTEGKITVSKNIQSIGGNTTLIAERGVTVQKGTTVQSKKSDKDASGGVTSVLIGHFVDDDTAPGKRKFIESRGWLWCDGSMRAPHHHINAWGVSGYKGSIESKDSFFSDTTFFIPLLSNITGTNGGINSSLLTLPIFSNISFEKLEINTSAYLSVLSRLAASNQLLINSLLYGDVFSLTQSNNFTSNALVKFSILGSSGYTLALPSLSRKNMVSNLLQWGQSLALAVGSSIPGPVGPAVKAIQIGLGVIRSASKLEVFLGIKRQDLFNPFKIVAKFKRDFKDPETWRSAHLIRKLGQGLDLTASAAKTGMQVRGFYAGLELKDFNLGMVRNLDISNLTLDQLQGMLPDVDMWQRLSKTVLNAGVSVLLPHQTTNALVNCEWGSLLITGNKSVTSLWNYDSNSLIVACSRDTFAGWGSSSSTQVVWKSIFTTLGAYRLGGDHYIGDQISAHAGGNLTLDPTFKVHQASDEDAVFMSDKNLLAEEGSSVKNHGSVIYSGKETAVNRGSMEGKTTIVDGRTGASNEGQMRSQDGEKVHSSEGHAKNSGLMECSSPTGTHQVAGKTAETTPTSAFKGGNLVFVYGEKELRFGGRVDMLPGGQIIHDCADGPATLAPGIILNTDGCTVYTKSGKQPEWTPPNANASEQAQADSEKAPEASPANPPSVTYINTNALRHELGLEAGNGVTIDTAYVLGKWPTLKPKDVEKLVKYLNWILLLQADSASNNYVKELSIKSAYKIIKKVDPNFEKSSAINLVSGILPQGFTAELIRTKWAHLSYKEAKEIAEKFNNITAYNLLIKLGVGIDKPKGKQKLNKHIDDSTQDITKVLNKNGPIITVENVKQLITPTMLAVPLAAPAPVSSEPQQLPQVEPTTTAPDRSPYKGPTHPVSIEGPPDVNADKWILIGQDINAPDALARRGHFANVNVNEIFIWTNGHHAFSSATTPIMVPNFTLMTDAITVRANSSYTAQGVLGLYALSKELVIQHGVLLEALKKLTLYGEQAIRCGHEIITTQWDKKGAKGETKDVQISTVTLRGGSSNAEPTNGQNKPCVLTIFSNGKFYGEATNFEAIGGNGEVWCKEGFFNGGYACPYLDTYSRRKGKKCYDTAFFSGYVKAPNGAFYIMTPEGKIIYQSGHFITQDGMFYNCKDDARFDSIRGYQMKTKKPPVGSGPFSEVKKLFRKKKRAYQEIESLATFNDRAPLFIRSSNGHIYLNARMNLPHSTVILDTKKVHFVRSILWKEKITKKWELNFSFGLFSISENDSILTQARKASDLFEDLSQGKYDNIFTPHASLRFGWRTHLRQNEFLGDACLNVGLLILPRSNGKLEQYNGFNLSSGQFVHYLNKWTINGAKLHSYEWSQFMGLYAHARVGFSSTDSSSMDVSAGAFYDESRYKGTHYVIGHANIGNGNVPAILILNNGFAHFSQAQEGIITNLIANTKQNKSQFGGFGGSVGVNIAGSTTGEVHVHSGYSRQNASRETGLQIDRTNTGNKVKVVSADLKGAIISGDGVYATNVHKSKPKSETTVTAGFGFSFTADNQQETQQATPILISINGQLNDHKAGISVPIGPSAAASQLILQYRYKDYQIISDSLGIIFSGETYQKLGNACANFINSIPILLSRSQFLPKSSIQSTATITDLPTILILDGQSAETHGEDIVNIPVHQGESIEQNIQYTELSPATINSKDPSFVDSADQETFLIQNLVKFEGELPSGLTSQLLRKSWYYYLSGRPKIGDLEFLETPVPFFCKNGPVTHFKYRLYGTPYYLETPNLKNMVFQTDHAISSSKSAYAQAAYHGANKKGSAIFIFNASQTADKDVGYFERASQFKGMRVRGAYGTTELDGLIIACAGKPEGVSLDRLLVHEMMHMNVARKFGRAIPGGDDNVDLYVKALFQDYNYRRSNMLQSPAIYLHTDMQRLYNTPRGYIRENLPRGLQDNAKDIFNRLSKGERYGALNKNINSISPSEIKAFIRAEDMFLAEPPAFLAEFDYRYPGGAKNLFPGTHKCLTGMGILRTPFNWRALKVGASMTLKVGMSKALPVLDFGLHVCHELDSGYSFPTAIGRGTVTTLVDNGIWSSMFCGLSSVSHPVAALGAGGGILIASAIPEPNPGELERLDARWEMANSGRWYSTAEYQMTPSQSWAAIKPLTKIGSALNTLSNYISEAIIDSAYYIGWYSGDDSYDDSLMQFSQPLTSNINLQEIPVPLFDINQQNTILQCSHEPVVDWEKY